LASNIFVTYRPIVWTCYIFKYPTNPLSKGKLENRGEIVTYNVDCIKNGHYANMATENNQKSKVEIYSSGRRTWIVKVQANSPFHFIGGGA
jgi:hypothetical protein